MKKGTGRRRGRREVKKTKLNLLVSFFIFIGRPFFYSILLLIYGLTFFFYLWKKIVRSSDNFSKSINSKYEFFLKRNTLKKTKALRLLKKQLILLSSVKFPQIHFKFKLPKFKLRFPKINIKKHRVKRRVLYSVKKPLRKLRPSIELFCFILGVTTSLYLYSFFINAIFTDLPSPQNLDSQEQSLTTKIYDRNKKLLYKIYKEQNRTFVKLSDMPITLKEATISIEDKDFYRHNGLSWKGILRAFYFYVTQGKKTGGSTITQQLIKNTLLTSEKTWQRKIKEAVLAVLVEEKYSKDQILEMYLNQVGFGGAAYGIEEASIKYFGKHVQKLNLAEAALLAGLPASPTRYSPFGNNPEFAYERQVLVLNRMVEDGYISEQQSTEAKKTKLKFAPQVIDITAPHFVMYVKELLVQKYGEKVVENGGLEVTTSLDLTIQEQAQKIVNDEILKLGDLHITNGAALVTNPQTGEILAMVGSKDYFAKDIQGNFNVTTSLRQPGSSIKPVNYSIALENGFTPATLIDDSPITYQVPGQEPYSPKNYDLRYHGQVPLRVALGSSYNIPAVKVLATFGVKKMIQRGTEMGITSWNDPSRFGLSLTLGGGEIKMVDLAVVYGVLANNGIRVDLNPILEVKDHTGHILEKNISGSQTPVLNPGVTFILTNILSDNNARTPAFGPASQLYISDRPVAVKTGTTQNMRDNWTIGYTPSFLTAVWVGNNDNTPMSYVASGVTGASPIWRKIMDKILSGKPIENFNKPDEVEEVNICATTGTLPCDGCPSIKKEYFLTGTKPTIACSAEKVKEIIEKKIQTTPAPRIL